MCFTSESRFYLYEFLVLIGTYILCLFFLTTPLFFYDKRNMRDFINNGGVHGDVTINEGHPNGNMRFEEMNAEQLRPHLNHHRELAQEERERLNKPVNFLLGISLIFGLVVAVWYFINGGFNESMVTLSFVGVGMPLFIVCAVGDKKSEFEIRQINTVNYIITLIRERA